MRTFKLDFDDFLDDDFELLAIHTTLESYHLAYFMNLTFDIQFKKSELIQDFDFYEFNDEKNQSLWNLVANKGVQEQADTLEEQSTLFFEAKSNPRYSSFFQN